MEASSSKHEATANTCRFLQLPHPIILDILSRLPIKQILHCRCVSKRFLSFVHDSEFASLHFSRSPPYILLKSIQPKNATNRLHLAHVDADAENFQVSRFKFTRKSNVPTDHIRKISACNGLVCFLGGNRGDPFYVCNPILGEFITIQPPSYNDRYRGNFWGLGYSTVTNEYKLLQSYNSVFESDNLCATAEIYTIGTGTWRSIGNAPSSYFVALPFNAFLNGALHWSNDSPNADEFIHSFDFDTEQFGFVPPPDHFRKKDQKFVGYPMIGVLGGCLFIIHIGNEVQVQYDIWVMKEYGVKESWTKQFVIQNLYPIEGIKVGNFYTPMVILSNGEILMMDDTTIVCYNQIRKQFRRTDFFRIHPVFNEIDAVAYTPCFVSLCNVAKGEHISRVQNGNGSSLSDSKYQSLRQDLYTRVLNTVLVVELDLRTPAPDEAVNYHASVEVVNRLSKSDDHGCQDQLTDGIRQLIDKNWEIQIKHVYREANSVADALAKRALNDPYGLRVFTETLPDITRLMKFDLSGMSSRRRNANSNV